MSPLVTTVLLDEMKIISSDNNSSVHLHFDDNSGENASTNGDSPREWALLVDVGTIDSLSLETNYLKENNQLLRIKSIQNADMKIKVMNHCQICYPHHPKIIKNKILKSTSRGVLKPSPTLRT